MEVPDGYTEEEVVDIIQRISSRLAEKFRFGYHEVNDMKQQAALFAWQGIENYDGVRPLENFLWIHVRNRLFNFKRNNYARPDKPCDNCPLNAYIDFECTAFDNMMDCDLYARWYDRNEIKKSLMSTKEHTDSYDHRDSSMEDKILSKDIYLLINSKIPVAFREDWIRYVNKVKLAKSKREALLEMIINILKENGIDPEER